MDHIYIIGIIQALFACVYFFVGKNRSLASKMAGVFMVFIALPLVANLVKGFLGYDGTLVFILMQASPFTFGPFLYIYTDVLIDERQRFKKGYLLHLLPFACIVILMAAGFQYTPPGDASSAFALGLDLRWIIKFVLVNISYVTYTILILVKLHRHRKNLADYFSTDSSEKTLLWLKLISVIFICSNVFISLFVLIYPLVSDSTFLKPGIFVDYGLTFFIFVFAMFSNMQPAIYREDGRRVVSGDNRGAMEDKRYRKSGLKEEDISRYISMIEEHMEKNKPYLDCELSIVDVSDQLDIKRHYITQILNERLRMNFNTYVNNFRVKYVMEKMKCETYSDESLLELAMVAGFNSKSTFNRIFKNLTGMTPSQFKKTLPDNLKQVPA